jgi:hypothetical protein
LYNKNKTILIAYPAGKKGAFIIPNNVTSIWDSAFWGCSGLTSISIPNSITSIGEYAFYECTSLTNVTIPNTVTKIGEGAFSSNSLASVTIPESVTTIGNKAFANNKLTNLEIPKSVTSIGYSAFENNNLTSVIIPESIKWIAANLFANNKLTSVTIPSSVTKIYREAFSYNNLTNITIPESILEIGEGAFSNNNISSITIPESVTKIEKNAFANNKLTSFIIQNNLTKVDVISIFTDNTTNATELLTVQKAYDLANDYRDKNDYDNAIKQYRLILKTYPNHTDSKNNLKAVWDKRIDENKKMYPAPFAGKWQHIIPSYSYTTEGSTRTETYTYKTGNQITTYHTTGTRTVTTPGHTVTVPAVTAVYEFNGINYTMYSMSAGKETSRKSGTFFYSGNLIEFDDGTTLPLKNNLLDGYTKQ